MNKKIRIAVIGLGKMANEVHLPILAALAHGGLYELGIACDLNREAARRAADKFGFARHTHRADAVFEDDAIDAVYIFGTADMHYRYGMAALAAGKHLFVEKPPAFSYEQALDLLHLARQRKRVAVVGFNRRFQRNINEACEELKKYSRLTSVEAFYHKPFLNESVRYGGYSWLSANSIHAIDVLCYFAGGAPSELYSAYNVISGDRPENFSALLIWPNGLHAVLACNHVGAVKSERYVLHGVDIAYECDRLDFVRIRDKQEERTTYDNTDEARGFTAEHREFADAVAGKISAPRHELIHGVVALRLTDLMERGYRGTLDWGGLERDEQHIPLLHTMNDKHASILVLNPDMIATALPAISRAYDVVYESDIAGMTEEKKQEVVAIITGKGGGAVEEQLLDMLPNIRAVGMVVNAVRGYNAEGVVARGIPLVNAADVYADTVAEFIVMQAIAGVRSAVRSHDVMRAGGWGVARTPAFSLRDTLFSKARRFAGIGLLSPLKPLLRPLTHLLARQGNKGADGAVKSKKGRSGAINFSGSTVGIIGWGAITAKTIPLFTAFGCTVLVHSEYLSDEEAVALHVKKADLLETLHADVISVQRGLSTRTERSIGAREIEHIRPGAVFINTARAGIVDMDALVERLERQDIVACLDVFDEEPLPPKHSLRRLPNVFLTSHIAGSTNAVYAHAAASVPQKVLQLLDGTYKGTVIGRELLGNMTQH